MGRIASQAIQQMRGGRHAVGGVPFGRRLTCPKPSVVESMTARTPVRLADLSLQHLMSYKICPPDTASMRRWLALHVLSL